MKRPARKLSLHEKLGYWIRHFKPIHLCWWFEKHGWKVPNYFVGTSSNYDLTHYMFGTDSGDSDPDAQTMGSEDDPLTNQAKETPFFVRFQIRETGGKAGSDSYWQLYYNTTNDPATASQVTTAGDGVVQIIDDPGSNITNFTATDTRLMSEFTGETYISGEYVDNADDTNAKYQLDSSDVLGYVEFMWCIQFESGAGNSTDYYFYPRCGDSVMDSHSVHPKATTTVAANPDINMADENPDVTDYVEIVVNIGINTADENPSVTDESIELILHPVDFSNFTEIDPGTTIEKTSHKINWSSLDVRNTDSRVFYDFGGNVFNDDFNHRFIFNVSNFSGSSPYCSIWSLTQNVDDGTALEAASEDFVSILAYNPGTPQLQLRLTEDGTPATQSVNISTGIDYYITIERDHDGGTNNTGRYTLRVYIYNYYGETGAVEVDTVYIDSGIGEQNDFRYLFVTNTWNTGDSDRFITAGIRSLEIYNIPIISYDNISLQENSEQYINPYFINQADENPEVSDYVNVAVSYSIDVNDDISLQDEDDEYLTLYEINIYDDITISDYSNVYEPINYYVNASTGDDTNDGSISTPWLHSPDDNDWAGGASPFNHGDRVYYAAAQVHYGGGIDLSTSKTVEYSSYGGGANPIYRACEDPADLSWTADGGEYYVSFGADPNFVYHGDIELDEGTVGSLNEGEWGWDSGNSRVYVRLSGDADPNNEDVLIPDTTYLINCYNSTVDQDISNMTFELSTSTLAGVKVNVSSKNYSFTDVKVWKCLRSGFYFASNTDIDMINCTVVLRDVPYYGIQFNGSCSGTLNGTDISGEWSAGKQQSYGIYAISSNITTIGGNIYELYRGICTSGSCPDGLISGVTIDDCSDGAFLNGSNYEITGCTISNCGSTQIYCGLDSNGNYIHGNIIRCTTAVETTIGIQLSNSDNNIVTGNQILDIWDEQAYPSGSGLGIHIYGSSEGNTIHGNWIEGCYQGIMFQETSGAANNVFEYNIVKDSHVNGLAIITKGTSATSHFWNNVIDHNPDAYGGHGVVFRGTAASGPLDYADFRNNIVIGRTDDEMVLFDSDAGTSWDIILDYNVYIQINASAHWEYGGTPYTSLTNWQTALDSTPVNGGDDNSATDTIAYYDENYVPIYGAAVIDSGVDLGNSYRLDYDGADQDLYGTGWEIGAYAFHHFYLSDNVSLIDVSLQYITPYLLSIENDITVSDYSDVEVISAANVNINVYDDIGVQEESQQYLTIYEVYISDDLTVQEEISQYLLLYEIYEYDSLIVEDYAEPLVTAPGLVSINQYDDITVQESANTEIAIYFISASDNLTIEDATSSYLTIYIINQYDQIAVQDECQVAEIGIGTRDISAYDDLIIQENADLFMPLYVVSTGDNIIVEDSVVSALDLFLISTYDQLSISDEIDAPINPYLISEYENIDVSEYAENVIVFKSQEVNVFESVGLTDYANAAYVVYPFLQAFLTVQATRSIIDIGQTMSELEVEDTPSIVSVTR